MRLLDLQPHFEFAAVLEPDSQLDFHPVALEFDLDSIGPLFELLNLEARNVP